MKIGILFLFVFLYHVSYAQYGCVDPQATNYNAAATINDGSCIYNATNYSLNVKDTLSPVLQEISGIVYWNGKLYGHNDSWNPAMIFEMDTTHGSITKEIYLEGITNNDWEDITQDDNYFYIGDIGNNAGDRTNLKVYKFPKAAIGANYYDTISANLIDVIQYSYPDQISFVANLHNTPFDCEALAYKNNKLHLFTKNWTTGLSVHYTIPTVAGTFVATKIDSLFTQNVLVTGADFASNDELMLIGHKVTGTAQASLWFITDFDNTDSFFVKGNKRKIDIGDALVVGQIESVCFSDSIHGFAANEHFNPIAVIDIPQKLYSFNSSAWYPYQINTGFQTLDNEVGEFTVLNKNHNIDIYFSLKERENVSIALYSSKGKKIRHKNFQLSEGEQKIIIDNLDIPDGIYFVILQKANGYRRFSKIFFQNR